MAEYVGLHLRVTLKDGPVVFGIISGLDKQTSNLVLHSAVTCFSDGRTIESPLLNLTGDRIKDLQVIPRPNQPATMVPSPAMAKLMPQSSPLAQPMPPMPPMHPLPHNPAAPFNGPSPMMPPMEPSSSYRPSPQFVPMASHTPVATKSSSSSSSSNVFIDPAIITVSGTHSATNGSTSQPGPEMKVSTKQAKDATKPSAVTEDANVVNKPNQIDSDSIVPPSKKADTAMKKESGKAKDSSKTKDSPKASKPKDSNKGKDSNTPKESSPSKTTSRPGTQKASSTAKEPGLPKESSKSKGFNPSKVSDELEEIGKEDSYKAPAKGPAKLPTFAATNRRDRCIPTETVEFTNYEDFVKSRGKSGKRYVASDEKKGTLTSPRLYGPGSVAKTGRPYVSKAANTKPESVVDPVATNTLVASLQLDSALTPTPSAESNDAGSATSATSSRKSSVSSSMKIPASLIPPKARSRSSVSAKPTPVISTTSVIGTNDSVSPLTDGITSPPPPVDLSSVSPLANTPSPPPTVVQKKEQQQGKKQNKAKQQEEEEMAELEGANAPLAPLPVDLTTSEPPIESHIRTVAGGQAIPTITSSQMRELENWCDAKTGPSLNMRVENGGHGTSVMALMAIGGRMRIQPGNHNAAPLVVVLAGNNTVGSYGLAAARHLANRGCQVVVLVTCGKNAALKEEVMEQKKCAEFAGARIVASTEDLPQRYTTPVDLIIDAMMGCHFTIRDLRDDYETRLLIWEAMDWANNNKAPVLSLELPSGINGEDGHPFHVMHYISPKWTLCFAVPKQGCTSRNVTGELFLADLGIPMVNLQKIGLQRFNIPWGTEFVLPLEYKDNPAL